jgi:hypothetical protein
MMVNYFENDQLTPIILGNCKESIKAAKTIKKNTGLEVTILSQKLSLINKIRFIHRKLTSFNEDILLLTLKDLAKDIQDYSTPLLIYCAEHRSDFIINNLSSLEHLYIIIPTKDINLYLKGNS